jgi:hypothetical protein
MMITKGQSQGMYQFLYIGSVQHHALEEGVALGADKAKFALLGS